MAVTKGLVNIGDAKITERLSVGTGNATGKYSVAEGSGTTASGDYSHAEGHNTTASGYDSHAEGLNTNASGYYSHAEGGSTQSQSNYSHAEGVSTVAHGLGSHAEGDATHANGYYSHSEGQYTIAEGASSHAEGCNTEANSSSSHAEGKDTISDGECSHAEGRNTEANGSNSHAEGRNTISNGECSHAEGLNTEANGSSSHSEGAYTEASGYYSHAEGFQTEASGKYSHAEGKNTKAFAWASHAEGGEYPEVMGEDNDIQVDSGSNDVDCHLISFSYQNGNLYLNFDYIPTYWDDDRYKKLKNGDIIQLKKWKKNIFYIYSINGNQLRVECLDDSNYTAYNNLLNNNVINSNLYKLLSYAGGAYSHSEGLKSHTNRWATAAHAEGAYTEAAGYYSHTEGSFTRATEHSSHAEGYSTEASGWYGSHSEGYGTDANGTASHAEGMHTDASGSGAHAEGAYTEASGYYSHAEGTNTLADSDCAHAEGNNTEATGQASHAEGGDTEASGSYSHAEGKYTKSRSSYSHAEGWYSRTGGSETANTLNSGDTTYTGLYSHAEGNATIAKGNSSHSEGVSTFAVGIGSHAEGGCAITYGNYSHAEGDTTTASGDTSHSEGCGTVAIGMCSHAEGLGHTPGISLEAYGNASHAEGFARGNKHVFDGGTREIWAYDDGTHAEGYSSQDLISDYNPSIYTNKIYGIYAGLQGSHAGGYVEHIQSQLSSVGDKIYGDYINSCDKMGLIDYYPWNAAYAQASFVHGNDVKAFNFADAVFGWGNRTINYAQEEVCAVYHIKSGEADTMVGMCAYITDATTGLGKYKPTGPITVCGMFNSTCVDGNPLDYGRIYYGYSGYTQTIHLNDYQPAFMVGNGWGPKPDHRCNAFVVDYNGNVFVGKGLTALDNVSAPNIQQSSDERLKNLHDEIKLDDCYKLINSARYIKFDFKNDKDKKEHIGLIAQDVQKVFPQTVSEDNNGNLALNYNSLVAVCMKTIKDLNERVTQLENEVKELKSKKNIKN